MKIGIIGAGFVGRAVAVTAIAHGHQVMVSNSRGPETLYSTVEVIGCQAGSAQHAAAFGDIVVVAIPFKAHQVLPVAALRGKVVLDASNYHPQRDGRIAELDRGETTTSELLARHLPASLIVKALNTIAALDIDVDGRPAGTRGRRALPIAGDDPDAKKAVADLLEEFGYDVVDGGPLHQGRRFEKDTPAYFVPMDAVELRLALGDPALRP